jgi:hypothetical protein
VSSGPDCCKNGSCSGKRIGEETIATGGLSIDLTPLLTLVSEVSEFSPCSLNPSFSISGTTTQKRACCEKKGGIGEIVDAEGSVSAGVVGTCFQGVTVTVPTWVPLPIEDRTLAQAGIEWTASLNANGDVSGTLSGECENCSLALGYGVSFGLGAAVTVEAGPFGASCGVSADAVTVSGSLSLCSGGPPLEIGACFGPVNLNCSGDVLGFSVSVAVELIGEACI